MLPNDEAVAMGDGTILDTTGKVFVDDGMGGFWKSAGEKQPPTNPWFDAIRNARPPRRRVPLRACGFTRRGGATRAGRTTTARRCTSHSKTRSSSSDDDGGGSEPGPHSHSQPHGVEPSGRRANSPRVEVAR